MKFELKCQIVAVFLPRDAMRKRGLCCRPVSVCPSVCLSVTLVYCIHTAENIVKLLSRSGSPIILVFLTPSTGTQFQGNPSVGRKIDGGWKSLRFSTEIAVNLENGTGYGCHVNYCLLWNVNRKS